MARFNKYKLNNGKNKGRYYAKAFSLIYLIFSAVLGIVLAVLSSFPQIILNVFGLRLAYALLSGIWFLLSFARLLTGNPRRKFKKLVKEKDNYLASEECAAVKQAIEYFKAL